MRISREGTAAAGLAALACLTITAAAQPPVDAIGPEALVRQRAHGAPQPRPSSESRRLRPGGETSRRSAARSTSCPQA